MKRFHMTAGLMVALTSTGLLLAQSDSENSRNSDDQSRQRQNRDDAGKNRNRNSDEDVIRLHYDDDAGRLSIDVDKDYQFDTERPRWEQNADFDIRYDMDDQDLRLSGKGKIDVNRAAGALARWWQSFWEEEKSARRSAQQGSESGARLFVRQYDDNDDGYLSRRELPADAKDDFQQADHNEDDHLSLAEVRRYGQDWFVSSQRQQRSAAQSRTARHAPAGNSSRQDDDNRTWSEWWASWWSGQEENPIDIPSDIRQDIISQGARQFIDRFDRNDDGVLVRSELPDSMYDDFGELDDNGDRQLSRQELVRHIPAG